ncbi:MAG: RNA polymerase factor sigma-54 [Hydrogenophaga sp.]
MKQGLSLRVSQHLALTPQLQQSIRLLQLSTLEMAQEVEQMLDENPFLDREEERADREDFGLDQGDAPVSASEQIAEATVLADAEGASLLQEGPLSVLSSSSSSESSGDAVESQIDGPAQLEESWEGDGSVEMAPDDGEWGGEAPARNNNSTAGDDDTATAADLARVPVSLQDHLHEQARCLRLSETEQAALYFLIESLNGDGYLDDDWTELALAFWRLLHGREAALPGIAAIVEAEGQLYAALEWLHDMEPTGVGARDLGECLRLQIEELRNSPAARAALAICGQPLELIAKRDVKRLCALCGLDDETVRAALGLIASLEPKPGRQFVDVERNVVVPDVIVTHAGRGFKVQLNAEVMPRLRVHDVYANAMRQNKDSGGSAGHAAMQQRLQEARWFIKNIQQRFDTILRVSTAIVERQRNFFMHGELAMRPLVLREIADELGLHESTISRVTTAKYMATPFGTFELKYFFGSSLGTETGGNASSTAVRALLRQLIAAEAPKKPLSDNQLSDLLKEQGIECARRTVAKYREALRIAPANLRKTL